MTMFDSLTLSEALPLLLPIIAIQFILLIIAVLAWRKTTKTLGNKWIWLVIIIVIGIIGPIAFLTIGRRNEGY